MAWDQEKIEKLTRLWQEGYSAAQVARRLGDGVSRNAVIGKIHRMGLEVRQKTLRKSPTRGPSKSAVRRSGGGASRKEGKRIAEAVPPPSPDNQVTFLELKENLCRWPHGDPEEGPMHFCGTKVAEKGIPYCDYHMRMAYQPGAVRAQSGAKSEDKKFA